MSNFRRRGESSYRGEPADGPGRSARTPGGSTEHMHLSPRAYPCHVRQPWAIGACVSAKKSGIQLATSLSHGQVCEASGLHVTSSQL